MVPDYVQIRLLALFHLILTTDENSNKAYGVYVPGPATLYFLPGTLRETNTMSVLQVRGLRLAERGPKAIQPDVEAGTQTQKLEDPTTSFIH